MNIIEIGQAAKDLVRDTLEDLTIPPYPQELGVGEATAELIEGEAEDILVALIESLK
jgi:hypothetical protein